MRNTMAGFFTFSEIPAKKPLCGPCLIWQKY